MGQRNVRSRTGAAALALVLSLALVAGTPLDAARAYAAEPLPAATAESEGASQPDTNANGAGESAKDPAGDGGSSSGQLSEDVPLDAPAGAPQDGSQAPAGADAAPSAPIDQSPASGQATAAVPLVPEAPKAVVGEVVQDGLVYRILDDGESVALVGWRGASLAGDVAVPYLVMSGEDAYAVTVIGDPDIDYTAADGSASGVLAGSGATSLSLPASVETVADGALSGCPSLESVFASPQNQKYASSDGMLFSKDLSALLFVPEGKRGTARIPDETSSAPASAFSSVSGLSAVHAGEGSAAFSAREGVLYSKDGASLLYFPAAAGNAVVLPAETESIGEGAFAQAEGLASIVALGYVRDIHETAFAEAAKRDAQVALPAGEDYDARKVVWEAAGFQSFVEPAAPGDAVGPTDPEGQPASGFVFTLLDDYTLSVGWAGEADPEADLVIPVAAKLNDVEYRVSAIATGGFQGRQSLSSVQIRAPITVIGDDAFASCTGLASVELAEGVSAIGAGAFSGTAVQRVVIPASVSSVGSRAFADCPNLSQVITFSNALSVAGDAISGCTGVSVYAPYNETGEYPWYVGIVASGNSIQPYGVSFSSDPLVIEVDETADLFEGGVREVPDGCELTYSYAATPISVEAGQVTGKKLGVSEVTAVLSLDGIELDRTVRTVNVAHDIMPMAGDPLYYNVTVKVMFDTVGGIPAQSDQIINYPKLYVGPGNDAYELTGIAKPAPITRPGYVFHSWTASDNDLNRVIDFDTLRRLVIDSFDYKNDGGYGEVTFTANWIPITYNIAFDGNGGTGTVNTVSNVTYDTTPTLPANSFNRPGYKFLGWNTQQNGGASARLAPGATTTPPNLASEDGKTVTLYAEWERAIPEGATGGTIGPEGDAVTWYITSDNELVLTPTNGVSGTLPDASTAAVFPWTENESITKVTIEKGVKAGTSLYHMFYKCSSIASIEGASNLDTSNVENMTSMFSGCASLQNVDVSSFDTSKVKLMDSMFNSCSRLQSLDVSKFKTANVQKMGNMFRGCSALESLSFDSWETANVTDMTNMFRGCAQLATLDLSSFNTSIVVGMGSMFNGCSKLESLNLSSFSTSSACSMDSMFQNCAKLGSLDLPNNKAFSASTTESMFYGCSSLQSLDLSGFDTSKVERMDNMFLGCSALQSLDLTNFKTENVANMGSMFKGCSGLTSLDVSSFVTSNNGNMNNMFYGCSGLTELNLSSFNTLNVTGMNSMFSGCENLASLDLSTFDTANVTNMGGMFSGCKKLATIKGIEKFDTAKVASMNSMFKECAALTSVDVSKFDTQNVGSMEYMFYGCMSLKSLDVSGFKTENVGSMGYMFQNCYGLSELNVSSFNTAKVTNMNYMFGWCSGLETLNVSNFSTSLVTGMNGMFQNCSGLKTLDLSSFETPKVITMINMFAGCSGLEALTISKFDTTLVTDMGGMFNGCSNLKALDVSKFNTSSVKSMYCMFQKCSSLKELNVANFNTENVQNLNGMFSGCSNVAALDVSKFKTTAAKHMNNMFNGCSSLTSLDVSNFKTENVENLSFMFYGCSGLTNLELSKWDTSNVNNVGGMFYGCSKLTSINLANWKTPKLTNMNSMFSGCSKLERVDFTNWDTSNVTITSGAFNKCFALTSVVGLGSLDTSKVTDMNSMFDSCVKLVSLDLSNWNTGNVQTSLDMYKGCSALAEVKVGTGYTLGFLAKPTGYANWKNSGGTSFAYDKIPAGVADTYTAELATYTITYNLDDGTLPNDAPASFTVKSPTISLPTPSKLGHGFGGWYDNEGLTGNAISDIPAGSVGNKTFFAKWIPSLFTFTLGSAKGIDTTGSTKTGNVTFGTLVTLKAAAKPGYQFSKWTSSNSVIVPDQLTADAVFVMPAGQLTMTPSATLVKYKISYELNGGEQQRGAIAQYDVETAVTLPTKPTREGFTFSGWYDNEGLTGDAVTAIEVSSIGDRKYYAKWERSIPEGVTGGTIGDGITWYITSANELVIAPTNGVSGTLPDYADGSPFPWTSAANNKSFTTVTIEAGVATGANASHLFDGCSELTAINGLSNLDTQNATNIGYMFIACSKLTSLDLSSFKTSSVTAMDNVFNGCSSIGELDVSKFNTSSVGSMGGMFLGCENLTSLRGLNAFDTSKVENMRSMFAGCASITEIDVSNFATTKVSSTYEMFGKCTQLVKLDLPAFDTGSVRTMERMFFECPALVELNLSGWNTSNVTNMANMFNECSSLKSVLLSGFDTKNVTAMSSMFNGCSSLETLDVSSFDVLNAEYMASIFEGCSSLTELNVSNWNPSKVKSMNYVFKGCSGLSNLDLGSWDTSSAASMQGMFSDCTSLTSINVPKFNTSNVTSMYEMFNGCSALTSLDLSNWSTEKVSDATGIFKDCSNLIEAKVGTGYTLGVLAQPTPGYTDKWANSGGTLYSYNQIPPGVADTYTAELATYSITYELNGGTLPNDAPTSFTMKSADITLPTPALDGNEFLGWYASTDFSGDCALVIPSGSTGKKTFYAKWKRSIPSGAEGDTIGDGITWYITKEKHLVITPTNGISGTLPRYVDDTTFPWSKNASIKSATIEPGVAANVDIAHMFEGCSGLQSVDIAGLVTSNVQSMASMFASCSSLTAIEVSKLDTSMAENMGHMFTGCSSLGMLDLSGFNTERVKYMDCMFEGCSSLQSLSISNFATPSVKNMANMFAGCSNLADITLPDGFVNASVTDASKLFFDCPALTTVPANLAFPESVPTAQVFGFTEAPAEFVVTTYVGDDPQLLAYDWASDCRLLNGMESSGSLPTTDNLDRGWWSVDTDGTLTIGCDEGSSISSLEWSWQIANNTDYWSPFRDQIVSIEMSPTVRAETMAYWFQGMHKLTDISGVFIPDNATSAYGLFRSCTSLTTIPESFTLPDNLTNVGGMFEYCSSLYSIADNFHLPSSAVSINTALMFNSCSSLVSLPSGFYLPGTANTSSGMFKGCSNLQTLPEKFVLPSGITAVDNMFNGCSSLLALPEGFSIPDKVTALKGMFKGCESLAALPEGFTIPRSLALDEGKMNEMFSSCNSLTVLPSSFDFPIEAANASTNPFMCANTDTLTYFAGSSDSAVRQYDWTSQNRKLVAADDPENPLPDTVHLVKFKLPNASGAYTEAAWLTSVTGTDGILPEMAAPTREGYAFVGWYVDEACTIAFDFTKSVTAQVEGAPNPVETLYARYTEARSTLPTTDGGEHASWKLTQDGTLRISCEDGYTIADFGWNADETEHSGYWSTVGSQVERVVMNENVKASSMAFWFDGMPNLVDISQVFIPEGTESVRALFRNCSKISVIPDDFRLPASVRHAGALFELTSIRTLPSGFTITEGVEDTSWMFNGCASLEVLPDAFTLATSVTNAQRMFSACTALTKLPEDFRWHTQSDVGYMFNGCTGLLSLPDGFTVPEGIKSITAAFRNCSSLRTLPSKFTIPEGVTNTTELFNGCSSLQSLPEGFSFPSSLRWINKMFYGCNNLRILPSTLSLKDLNADANRLLKEAFYVSEGEPLATYYPGDAAEVTPGDGYWETQNRTLVTKTDDLPAGVKVVHFKTASLTTPGQWDDYATVLTDESGKLTQPGDPQAFGYPFKGWYTSEACMTKFDFGKQIIADDVVVYGAFGAPILRGTVPLEANVVVDASGGATTASAEIRSFTPVDIDLTSIACETVPGIAELFPDEADRTKPFVTVQFPDQAEPVKAPFTGQPAATSVTVPLSTGWTSPGTKSCDISLDLNGANMRHRIEGHSANVANIVWTIKVKE